MPLALDRRVTFVAKSDYFTGVGIKGWAQKRFFSGTGQVPIDRTGGKAAEGALRAGLKVLSRGELFGIYPEGTRSHDGRLYKGRTGVARLALLAGVPVVPSAVIGTDVIAPPGKIMAKIVSPTVKFGRPLDFSRYDGMSEDRFILRSITDEIMYEIMELSGQEYVDLYAPTAKELAAKEQAPPRRTRSPRRPDPAPPTLRSSAAATRRRHAQRADHSVEVQVSRCARASARRSRAASRRLRRWRPARCRDRHGRSTARRGLPGGSPGLVASPALVVRARPA